MANEEGGEEERVSYFCLFVCLSVLVFVHWRGGCGIWKGVRGGEGSLRRDVTLKKGEDRQEEYEIGRKPLYFCSCFYFVLILEKKEASYRKIYTAHISVPALSFPPSAWARLACRLGRCWS